MSSKNWLFGTALTFMVAILIPLLALLTDIVEVIALLAINKPTDTGGRCGTCRRY